MAGVLRKTRAEEVEREEVFFLDVLLGDALYRCHVLYAWAKW